ncbi:MAG: uracil-DNA glycosylase [Rhodoferax sp.]
MHTPLNAAQRALLDTMGIWWPAPPEALPDAALPAPGRALPPRRSGAGPVPPPPGAGDAPPEDARARTVAPAQASAVPQSAAPVSARTPPPPVPPAAAPEAVPQQQARLSGSGASSAGDWAAWVHAVGQCQACGLHATRGTGVLRADQAPVQADWMVVLDPPEAAEELEGQAVVGDSARLLDAMLRAVGVHRGGNGAQGAYLSTVLKCRPPPAHVPQAQELAQCQQHLRAEIERVRPRVLLLMGRFAPRLLEQAAQVPLEQLRAQVHHFAGVPAVVSYPPRALLRNPAYKARAWADLCLAADLAAGQR